MKCTVCTKKARPGLKTCSAECVRKAQSRSRKGKLPGIAKLDAKKVREIRRRVARGEKQVALSLEFGVSKTTVCRIISGEVWGSVS